MHSVADHLDDLGLVQGFVLLMAGTEIEHASRADAVRHPGTELLAVVELGVEDHCVGFAAAELFVVALFLADHEIMVGLHVDSGRGDIPRRVDDLRVLRQRRTGRAQDSGRQSDLLHIVHR